MHDLFPAISKMQNLIYSLPMKAQRAIEFLNDVELSLPPKPLEDEERFEIFYPLRNDLADITASIVGEYLDLNDTIDKKSLIYPRLIEFLALLKAYQQTIISNEIFQIMEKRFERIESILSSSNFDFRVHVQEIQEGYLGGEVIQNINNAITKFDKGEFHEAISKCGIANESLAFRFKDYLKNVYRIELFQNKVAPLLDEIKKQLQNTSDKERFTLAKSGRLEWFLRSLLEAGHFLRNLGSHSTESEEDLPEWVKIYRKSMTSRVEYARLALVCIIQAAKELQELIIRNRP